MLPVERRSTRGLPVGLLALAGVLMAARLVTGIAQTSQSVPSGGLVRWRLLEGAEAASSTEGKPILYDFSAAWCEPCRRMENELFADGASAEFISKTYVAVRVTDEDASPAAAALRERYGVDSLPTLVIVTSGRKTPQRERGYPGKRRTMTFLRAAATSPPP